MDAKEIAAAQRLFGQDKERCGICRREEELEMCVPCGRGVCESCSATHLGDGST